MSRMYFTLSVDLSRLSEGQKRGTRICIDRGQQQECVVHYHRFIHFWLVVALGEVVIESNLFARPSHLDDEVKVTHLPLNASTGDLDQVWQPCMRLTLTARHVAQVGVGGGGLVLSCNQSRAEDEAKKGGKKL